MGKSKLKRRKRAKMAKIAKDEPRDSNIPIPNLPEKFLLMRVKSGTKMRNVLGYALKEFPKYNNIVWAAAGQGIKKAISCAEIFKKKLGGLHQLTKLRYIKSEKSEETVESLNSKDQVPEIHILQGKEVSSTSEPGYQAPEDNGQFENHKIVEESKNTKQETAQESYMEREELAQIMISLRTGIKRPRSEPQTQDLAKKHKIKEEIENEECTTKDTNIELVEDETQEAESIIKTEGIAEEKGLAEKTGVAEAVTKEQEITEEEGVIELKITENESCS